MRRLAGGDTLLPNADGLYNSSAVPHDDRWDLPLPALDDTLDYMRRVQETMLARLDAPVAGAQETS